MFYKLYKALQHTYEIKPYAKSKKADGCDHDWEVVKETYAYYKWFYGNQNVNKSETNKPFFSIHNHRVYPKNKVCLKCGECDKQIERWENRYKEQQRKEANDKKEKRRRKAWAKQLWEDGCKNGS